MHLKSRRLETLLVIIVMVSMIASLLGLALKSTTVLADMHYDYVISKIVTNITNPDMTDGGSVVDQVGDMISYRVVVENKSNGGTGGGPGGGAKPDLSQVTVYDSLLGNYLGSPDAGDTDSDGWLDWKEIWSWDYTYPVTQTDIDTSGSDGYIENTATVDCDQIDPKSASVAVDVVLKNQAYITVIKNVINDNGGSALPDDFNLTLDDMSVTSGVAVPVDPGTYSVGETQLPGYTFVGFSGDCDSNGSVSVAPGESKTCFLTNDDDDDDQQAYITVIKEVINDNGGSALPDDFLLTLDGESVTSGVAVPVDPGTYTVGETLLPGYTFVGFSGDCDSNGSVTIALGESKTCTLTNDDQQAYITVVKNVINDDGGSALPDDFNLTLDGEPVTSGMPVPVDPGTYTVDETLLPGYTFVGFSGDYDSNGSVTVALGESKTCILTNDDNDDQEAPVTTLSGPDTRISLNFCCTLAGNSIYAGDRTTARIIETNTGDEPLINPYVWLGRLNPATDSVIGSWTMGKDDPHYSSGDTNDDGILDPGESWKWFILGIEINNDTLFVAEGHGWTDPEVGQPEDITWPDYPNERDSMRINVIEPPAITIQSTPDTTVTIVASANNVSSGGTVNVTVTEENTGDEQLTNPYVWVGGIDPATGLVVDVNIDDTEANGWAMGKADPHYISGDTNNNSKLDPGEIWTWEISDVEIVGDGVYIIAKGHGWSSGQEEDIAYPDYPNERDSVYVKVI